MILNTSSVRTLILRASSVSSIVCLKRSSHSSTYIFCIHTVSVVEKSEEVICSSTANVPLHYATTLLFCIVVCRTVSLMEECMESVEKDCSQSDVSVRRQYTEAAQCDQGRTRPGIGHDNGTRYVGYVCRLTMFKQLAHLKFLCFCIIHLHYSLKHVLLRLCSG